MLGRTPDARPGAAGNPHGRGATAEPTLSSARGARARYFVRNNSLTRIVQDHRTIGRVTERTAMTSILLVEDDEDVRVLVEDMLLDAGYEVDPTDTVAGAVSRLDTRSYDLLLTDGRLPDGTGLTIAAVASVKGIKVLLFTGYAHDFPPAELARYTVLTKPMGMGLLVQTVQRMISSGQGIAAPSTRPELPPESIRARPW